MRSIALLALVSATLAGCVTPPGQMTETDFHWTEAQAPVSYSAAYKNITNGFRSCGNFDAGYQECSVDEDAKQVLCDVYASTLMGQSPSVIGRILVTSVDEDHVQVRSGTNHGDSSGRRLRREMWNGFAAGETACK